MKRSEFLRLISTLPLSIAAMKSEYFNDLIKKNENFNRMPVLFLGHGSPMNAIEENEFVYGFRAATKRIQKPNAILVISAHWETNGTYLTAMEKPRTIHDFSGFPKELYQVNYPALGNPELAKEIKNKVRFTPVGLDQHWGLDHGCWSVVKHLYPNADIPVIQLSLDYNKSPQYHYELAKEINFLRDKGILIIGSGNMVHNLGRVAWDKLNQTFAYDWALEASEKMKSCIKSGDHKTLINFDAQGNAFKLSIPTPEHYLPLLYILSLQQKNEPVELFNDKPLAGSLFMTSLKIG